MANEADEQSIIRGLQAQLRQECQVNGTLRTENLSLKGQVSALRHQLSERCKPSPVEKRIGNDPYALIGNPYEGG